MLSYLAKSLVDKPDQVEIRVSESEGGKLYELKVAPEDVGKVIGRDGRTVNAIRTVLAAAAQKTGEKARLEILDDRRNSPTASPPEQAEPPAVEAAPPPEP
ncbi:MAG: KH domain-containing protein [Myxococcaceae bacterium]